MKNILLIEDNKDISQNVKEYLEMEDYCVDQAFDGEVGIEKATRGDYDIILLDLSLPEVDGITIARKVSQKKNTPIIMTTARGGVDDRLLGFEMWAIDYLVKPFDLRELLARIRVHLSSETTGVNQEQACIMVAGAEICTEKRTFRNKEWEEVHLTQKEFLILQKLIDQKQNVVSRSDIIEYLWWTDALFEWGDNKLDVYISNLRSKLWKAVIKTIKWVGYTLWE